MKLRSELANYEITILELSTVNAKFIFSINNYIDLRGLFKIQYLQLQLMV